MKWKHFIIINLLCMITVGYFSFEFGRMVQRQADVKEYFTTAQDEERFIIETINLVICESGNKHEGVWGDNGKAYGRFQFWKIGFDDLVKITGNEDLLLDWQNSTHQYFIYKQAYKKQLTSKYWSCFRPVDF